MTIRFIGAAGHLMANRVLPSRQPSETFLEQLGWDTHSKENSLSKTNQSQASDFDSEIRAFEAQIANAGLHIIVDSAARAQYGQLIKALSDDLRAQATSGKITWAQAAAQAQEARNAVMQIIRNKSTPVGRAIAESLKKEGRTLNQLVAKKAIELFGPGADFEKLSPTQRNGVYAAIVKSAGKSDPVVTASMRRLSHAGRGLVVLSLALSVYTIAQAQDKVAAAGRELAVTGASITGGIAGGALAGLACGPGAPVCVTVGAFVGGALAALGVSFMW
jgi:hypothetical protein